MAAIMTVPEVEALTAKQGEFVTAYVANGGNVEAACNVAGYAECSNGYKTLKLPHVQAAVVALRSLVIDMDLGTLGLKVMKELLTDGKTPAHVRFQAAKYALGLAGHCEAEPSTKDETKNKPLAEMSLDELKDYVAKGKVILDALPTAHAHVIESPPVKPVSVE